MHSHLLFLGIVFCFQAISMNEEAQNNEIVRLSIGGYKIDTTYETIELSGSDYLKALLSGKYKIPKTSTGRIFIDRPKKEGKLLDYFMRTQQSPENFDKNIVKSVADFFCIPSILKLIDHNDKKNASSQKSFFATFGQICIECGIELNPNNVLDHLIFRHKAIIYMVDRKKNDRVWTITYKLPFDCSKK